MKKRILIIEDEQLIREILKDTLEIEGFEVVVACNGLDALALIKQNGIPDLIVSDYKMPRMDGLEFRRIQLLDEKLARIPYILMSASIDLDFKDFGNPTFIQKPINLNNLLKLIFGHLP